MLGEEALGLALGRGRKLDIKVLKGTQLSGKRNGPNVEISPYSKV